MRTSTISYQDSGFFSKIVLAYVENDERLAPFVTNFPNLQSIEEQILEKKRSYSNRPIIQNVLKKQYAGLSLKTAVQTNLNLLSNEHTFSITTAHQPNIFTGPLYTIYKAIHTICLANQYKQLFPHYNFIPIYYIGSEDHDIEEIGHVQINQDQYAWEPKQKGACGEMNPSTLIPILDEIKKKFNLNHPEEQAVISIFEMAYQKANSLAEATRIIFHELLGDYGLLVFDANNPACKSLFSNVIKDELLQQSSEKIVERSVADLSKHFKIQAKPRSINLFYKLTNQLRERIELIDGEYHVVNTDIRFTESAILQELKQFPERFSPNVILRPLLQEILLPNISFVGGGGELAYWLQLKALFDYHHIQYPLLYLRHSVLVVDRKTHRQLLKQQLQVSDLFHEPKEVLTQQAKKENRLMELEKQSDNIRLAFDKIEEIGDTISPNLSKSMKAHHAKHDRILHRIREKYVSHLVRLESDKLNTLLSARETLFPNASLQERTESFLTLFKRYGSNFIPTLLSKMQMAESTFLILEEE